MKFVYPDINYLFDTKSDKVNSIIIENACLFRAIITDIYYQINNYEGRAVLSDERGQLQFSKSCEVLSQFVPFDLNQKTLTTKIVNEMGKRAVSGEKYLETQELLTSIERYMNDLSFDMNCNLSFEDIDISSIIKASNLKIEEEYNSLGEKIIDYMELVSEFDREKMFITVNLRSYISDEEANWFVDTILKHCYNVIMIENYEHKKLDKEQRYIIDKDLCEIG